MKRIGLLTALLLLSCMVFAQTTDTTKTAFSLKEAQNYAVTHSYNAQYSTIEKEKVNRQMDELIGIGMPQINGSVQYNYNIKPPVAFFPGEFFGAPGTFQAITISPKQNSTLGLSLNQLILDGSYFIGLQAAKTQRQVAGKINEKDLLNVKADVTTTYYSILVIQENRRVLGESMAKLEDTYNQTKGIYEQGFVEETDVDQLKLILSNVKNLAETLDRQIALAKNLLKFQMGVELSKEITLTDNLDKVLAETPTDSPLTASAGTENNLDYQLLLKQSYLAKLNYKRLIATYTPSLSGFISYQWQNFSNSNRLFADQSKYYGISVAGISLRVPIFDGLATVNRIRYAKLDYKKTEIAKVNMAEGIKLQSDQLNVGYANALGTFKVKKENMDLAKKVKERALIKYQEGVGSSLELTTAENQYLQAQADYITSLLDLLNAKVSINKLLNNF